MAEFIERPRFVLPGLPGGNPWANWPRPWFDRRPVGFGCLRSALLGGTNLGFPSEI